MCHPAPAHLLWSRPDVIELWKEWGEDVEVPEKLQEEDAIKKHCIVSTILAFLGAQGTRKSLLSTLGTCGCGFQ
jgi:hypothetical protein